MTSRSERRDALRTESAFLNRAIGDVGATEGRTLTGLAMPWDKVAVVRDIIGGRPGPKYPEAFAPASCDRTLTAHESFPVFAGLHDVTTEPIGVVRFRRSDIEGGLVFAAPLSNTPRANDYLELTNDGATRSVSIQFRPVQDQARQFPGVRGPVKYRTEVGLRHLALAPTGYGQYDEARVLSVRAIDPAITAAVEAADAAVDAAMKCLDPTDDDCNIEQAMALLQAADIATDAALEAIGAPDPDDDDGEDADAIDIVGTLTGARARMWSTVARRRRVERMALPDFD